MQNTFLMHNELSKAIIYDKNIIKYIRVSIKLKLNVRNRF